MKVCRSRARSAQLVGDRDRDRDIEGRVRRAADDTRLCVDGKAILGQLRSRERVIADGVFHLSRGHRVGVSHAGLGHFAIGEHHRRRVLDDGKRELHRPRVAVVVVRGAQVECEGLAVVGNIPSAAERGREAAVTRPVRVKVQP
ncbi:hypothetical protein D3C87_1517950 [compost metagenome]